MNCNNQVVTISKIVNGGYGLSETVDGKKLFVRHCLPGETVSVQITDEKKRIAFGHAVKICTPVSGRTTPPCPYYGKCGGCDLQHADYQTQLRLKETILEELLARSPVADTALKSGVLRPIVGADQPLGYRQRIRLKIDGRGKPGFTHFRSHKVIEVAQCQLAAEPLNTCLSSLRAQASFKSLAAVAEEGELLFDELSATVVLRLLLKRPVRPADRRHALDLTAAIATLDRVFFHGRKFAQEGPIGGEEAQSKLLGVTCDAAEPLTLRWEVGGFSQVNQRQNLKMIELVQQGARPGPSDQILDLYCGMGNFSLPLAREAAGVIGIEGQGSAIRSARRNSEYNRITNCSFIKSEVASACRKLVDDGARFDLVVCDPPRRGLGSLAGLVGTLARRKVIYVSCDPATLVRDLQVLVDLGLSIKTIQPVDMFPQTHHLETVAVLEKNGSSQ